VLPRLDELSSRVRETLLKGLVDKDRQSEAVVSGVLNFAATSSTGATPSTAFVVRTSAEGNCLCAAVSMAIWGLNDTNWEFREHMLSLLQSATEQAKEIRERFDEEQRLADSRVGVRLGERDLDTLFDEELARISLPRSFRGRSEVYLSPLSVFVLANLLRRSIVVTGDEESVAAGVGGLYLPLLWPAADCSRLVLPILFTRLPAGHFSAIAVEQGVGGVSSFPLGTVTGRLPVRFHRHPTTVATERELVASYVELVEGTADRDLPWAVMKKSTESDVQGALVNALLDAFLSHSVCFRC